jgi:hypothetical protein
MYYPGAADADMGPTAIVPSSHILARDGLGLSLGVQVGFGRIVVSEIEVSNMIVSKYGTK